MKTKQNAGVNPCEKGNPCLFLGLGDTHSITYSTAKVVLVKEERNKNNVAGRINNIAGCTCICM